MIGKSLHTEIVTYECYSVKLIVVMTKVNQNEREKSMRSKPMVVATWMFVNPRLKISLLSGAQLGTVKTIIHFRLWYVI